MSKTRRCPECGLDEASWGDERGFGINYCCQQCAELGECRCGDSRAQETMRHWKPLRGRWAEFTAQLNARWDKLSSTEIERLEGRRGDFIARIRDRYEIEHEDAERQVDDFCASLREKLETNEEDSQ